jgi:hypothetical protein
MLLITQFYQAYCNDLCLKSKYPLQNATLGVLDAEEGNVLRRQAELWSKG